MDRKFIIERQGKEFVLYAGLLDLAHKSGLISIQTAAVRVEPALALFKATVTIAKDGEGAKTYEGHGDATPENVGRNIAPHFIRMAETRAKARALRDALNIGAASLEELGDEDEPAPRQQQRPPAPRASANPHGPPDMDDVEAHHSQGQRVPPPGDTDEAFPGMDVRPVAAPTPINRAPAAGQHQSFDQATPAQVRAIYLIGRDQLGETDEQIDDRSIAMFHKPPPELTKKQASDLITRLKAGRAG